MDQIFQTLIQTIQTQQQKIDTIAQKLQLIESIGGGGGGTASIEDYQSGKVYTRNMLVVDPNTETVYRALHEYTSVTVEADTANGDLKLVGYENAFIAFPHNPSQQEINTVPEGSLVAVYSPDNPYNGGN